jgi:hypothetical protein
MDGKDYYAIVKNLESANLGHPICSDKPQPAYHVIMISSQTKRSMVPPNELHSLFFLFCF